VVESSGLLNRRRVKNSTGGSNPPLSARNQLVTRYLACRVANRFRLYFGVLLILY
jgi:hypothetical protein